MSGSWTCLFFTWTRGVVFFFVDVRCRVDVNVCGLVESLLRRYFVVDVRCRVDVNVHGLVESYLLRWRALSGLTRACVDSRSRFLFSVSGWHELYGLMKTSLTYLWCKGIFILCTSILKCVFSRLSVKWAWDVVLNCVITRRFGRTFIRIYISLVHL